MCLFADLRFGWALASFLALSHTRSDRQQDNSATLLAGETQDPGELVKMAMDFVHQNIGRDDENFVRFVTVCDGSKKEACGPRGSLLPDVVRIHGRRATANKYAYTPQGLF
jgi:hypothetical protein